MRLALAAGCGLLAFIFINFFITIDRYHENAKDIYVINRSVLIDTGIDLYSETPDRKSRLPPWLKYLDSMTFSLMFDMETFIIEGVADTFVKKSSFAFNFLVNYGRQRTLGIKIDNWASVNRVSFIQSAPDVNLDLVQQSTHQMVDIHNEAIDELLIADYQFTPFLEASRMGQTVKRNIFSSPGVEGFIVLSVLATIIMILVCINYMNIAVASAAYGLKEIGIRKVTGGNGMQLGITLSREFVTLLFIASMVGVPASYYATLALLSTITKYPLWSFPGYHLW